MDVSNIQDPRSHGMISSNSKKARVEVIVVPFPCHSHLNQLLQLSCLISSSHNIPVHYATSATHLCQVQLRFNSQTHLQNPHIHFHEFPTPPFLSPPPNPNSSSKFPSHLLPSFEASIQLRDPVAALLREISNTATRVVVIHDFLMAYVVQDVATIPNAESYIFSPVSVFQRSFRVLKDNKSFQSLEELKGLASIQGNWTPEILNFFALQEEYQSLAAGTIFNSCRSIEVDRGPNILEAKPKYLKTSKCANGNYGPVHFGTPISLQLQPKLKKHRYGFHKFFSPKTPPLSYQYFVVNGIITFAATSQFHNHHKPDGRTQSKLSAAVKIWCTCDMPPSRIRRSSLPAVYEGEVVVEKTMVLNGDGPAGEDATSEHSATSRIDQRRRRRCRTTFDLAF